ncbi:MAG: glycosyltransferase family 39 protein [Chloracidobacterium sp.]|nr:glycosyltransferase family 39 protein [Chloracidobacterium sp.]
MENTKTETEPSFEVPRYVWVSLAVLAVVAYFVGLNLPFLGPDEPRYAQVAREMFERGDWVTPTLGGFNWFEKPALLYWFEIASYNIFGVSEFAARLGPALCGLGTVASLWILGRNIDSDSKTEDQSPKTDFANWLALIAASTLGILIFAHGASFDIIVTFPMTAALVGFFIFDQAKDRSFKKYHLPLLSFYFFIGVSLLAKGLIGIIFPIAIVAFYHILAWKMPSKIFVLSLFWGTVIAVAVASIWYVPVISRNGWPFVDEFFIQHHFQRFTSNKYQHPQPFYFFIWVLPLMTLPWLPFFFAAIWNFVRGIFPRRDAVTQRDQMSPLVSASPLILFSIAWLLVPLVFFSLSGSKLPGYILPAVPAAVILTSSYIYRLVEQSDRWKTAVLSGAALVFIATFALAAFVVPRFSSSETVKGLFEAANARGLTTERVFTLHTISHSTEFYAAGRLLREPDGKLKKLYNPSEVVSEMQRTNAKTALVLVPLEYQKQLTDSTLLTSEVLQNNGELAIVAVKLK